MLSYIFRSYLGFSLLMMFGFLVVLAYLGAVGVEFICNQCQRKGMHTEIHFYV